MAQGAKVNADWEIPMPANAGQYVTVLKLVVLLAPVCAAVFTLALVLLSTCTAYDMQMYMACHCKGCKSKRKKLKRH